MDLSYVPLIAVMPGSADCGRPHLLAGVICLSWAAAFSRLPVDVAIDVVAAYPRLAPAGAGPGDVHGTQFAGRDEAVDVREAASQAASGSGDRQELKGRLPVPLSAQFRLCRHLSTPGQTMWLYHSSSPWHIGLRDVN
jgi:hypothetical protein